MDAKSILKVKNDLVDYSNDDLYQLAKYFDIDRNIEINDLTWIIAISVFRQYNSATMPKGKYMESESEEEYTEESNPDSEEEYTEESEPDSEEESESESEEESESEPESEEESESEESSEVVVRRSTRERRIPITTELDNYRQVLDDIGQSQTLLKQLFSDPLKLDTSKVSIKRITQYDGKCTACNLHRLIKYTIRIGDEEFDIGPHCYARISPLIDMAEALQRLDMGDPSARGDFQEYLDDAHYQIAHVKSIYKQRFG